MDVGYAYTIANFCGCRLKKGLNGIGIPDLIIAQNAKQNHCSIYSLGNHFNLVENILKIKLIDR
jgi:hypothetical protein